MSRSLPKKTVFALTALFISHLIWAAATSIAKITIENIPVFSFLLIRFIIVCVILLPFVIWELKKNPIHKKDVFNFIILGLLGQSSLILFFIGLNYTTSLDAVILGVTAPLFAIFAGHHFFKDRINMEVKVGVLVATIGTVFVMLDPLINGDSTGVNTQMRLLGNFLILLYNLLFTAFLLWSKMVMGEKSITLRNDLRNINIRPMSKSYSPTIVTYITFYVGLATFIPFAVLENFGIFGDNVFMLNHFTSVPFLGTLYMAIFSSIVAYLLFQWGLEESTVSDTAIFGYLSPIMALPFSYAILGEVPTKSVILGGILIAIGVYLSERFKTAKS